MQEQEALHELARLYGLETTYHDISGRLRTAGPESLLAVLRELEAPLDEGGPTAALAARRSELAERLVEPVVVAWDGGGEAPLRLTRPGPVEVHLRLEDGAERGFLVEADRLRPLGAAEEGTPRWGVPLGDLPPGYHRLLVRAGGVREEAVVIAAPSRAWCGDGGRMWGVFLPLYALRTAASWGTGDFSDLAKLAAWTADLGGGVVGTLPLLSAFLDQPFEPSPYAPASRLFWNELYLDPRALPEVALSPAVQRLLESPELGAQIAALRATELVDYDRSMILKRRILEDLAHGFFARGAGRRDELERFVRERPELERYAAFRAVGDRRGEPWQCWPERLREGGLAPADYDQEDFRYHLWVQWAAAGQIEALAREARRHGPGLYLDLPVGVHPSAYDVWRERDLFALGASAGAPPDGFFTRGQDWGFPPLRPEALRAQGYSHLVACLRHHLAHAGILRIDHVMQLQRLFWVPQGMEPGDGVYVRYPAAELLALLCLESQRHRTLVVGENLGTVPPEVNEAMDRHGIAGMYVLQYELAPGAPGVSGLGRTPPATTAASLNTHDMPPFAAFWEGRDIDDRLDLALLDEEQARAERERLADLRRQLADFLHRSGGAVADEAPLPAVLRGLLEHLAASPARLLLVNLEDLWLETRPQNVPGTSSERPNWRRKARLTFEQFSTDPGVVGTLRRVDELRRR